MTSSTTQTTPLPLSDEAQATAMALLVKELAEGMECLLRHLGNKLEAHEAAHWRAITNKALALFKREPLRIVVDMTDGLIHGVYCSEPVEVLFMSGAAADVEADDQQAYGYVGMNGRPMALLMHVSDGFEVEMFENEKFAVDTFLVDHCFNQWHKPPGFSAKKQKGASHE